MSRIDTYRAKDTRLLAGIMSGTSLDGIDVAFVELSGAGGETKFRLHDFHCVPFREAIKRRLLDASSNAMTLHQTFELDADLGAVYADAILEAASELGLRLHDLDAIGLHGQTVYHAPERRPFGVTVQIGSAAIVAQRTNALVVSNFRAADVAAGGHGAPLVPYCDYLLLHSQEQNRIALNIGGIANVTWLPKDASLDTLTAFDTGPGNVLIDTAMRTLYGREFDPEGSVAAQGTTNKDWLEELLSDEYFALHPPKSTGRERFGEQTGRRLAEQAIIRDLEPVDIIATLTMLTARSIADGIRRFASGSRAIDEIIVGGGGMRNRTMMRMLHEEFPGTDIFDAERYGLPAEAKEAICFAILANESLHEIPTNVPSVTGAGRRVVCGIITL